MGSPQGSPPKPEDRSPRKVARTISAHTPSRLSSVAQSSAGMSESEEVIGGDITVKMEPGKAPKLARSSTKKIPTRNAPKFLDYPDASQEAGRTFQKLDACTYANKWMGTTDAAFDCDCEEDWDKDKKVNHACGEDSDCINRATKMECGEDCLCGSGCENQRLRRKQWANVTVFRTEKKGFGLKINEDIEANTLIFEYVGEVIGEQAFHNRREKYHKEGIKHFYFMTLTSSEFVDATKKGNLGRFCNHSCDPNCYVDKWVVDDRLRMGIYSERRVEAGEELTFNYNVDRYGADPTPCYCGEPNCTGFLGGKTQTERATKLPALTIEALGIEDADDWDTAVAKRGRAKKKTGEADEEYVDRVQPKSLDEATVTKVMATLRQCKEKWIVVKLLSRLQEAEDDRVRGRVVRMHGYPIFKTVLSTWAEDVNVVLQVFDILQKLPMITRNKIQDSKIEEAMQGLKLNDNEQVKEQASTIMSTWSKLEVGYRIQKRVRGANPEQDQKDKEDRRAVMMRERGRARTKSRSPSPTPVAPTGPAVPTGPRSGNKLPQRPPGFYNGPPRNFNPRPPPPPAALPSGWYEAFNTKGEKYYYNRFGGTTWDRPVNAADAPPPPPKISKQNQAYQDLINEITSQPKQPAQPTPPVKPTSPMPTRDVSSITFEPSKDSRISTSAKDKDDWRTWSESRQKKTYEITIHPIINEIMGRYKNKIPRADLKRFAKELGQKIVNTDFKKGRVKDPKKIGDKDSVRKYVKEWFAKIAAKQPDHEKRVAEKDAAKKTAELNGNGDTTMTGATPDAAAMPANVYSPAGNTPEGEPETTITPDDSLDSDRPKRKREADETPLTGVSPGNDVTADAEQEMTKRLCVERGPLEIPPPPPRAIYDDEPTAGDEDAEDGSEDMDMDESPETIGREGQALNA